MDRVVARRRLPRAALWGAAAVTVVAVAAGVAALLPPPGSLVVPGAEADSARVVQAPFQDYLPVRAQAEPLHTTVVGAVQGGQVATVVAQEGATVAPGSPLVVLSNPQLQLDVTAREAQISSSLGEVSAQSLTLQKARADRELALAQAGYDLGKAQRDLDVRQRLHAQGYVSDAGVKSFAEEAAFDAARVMTLKATGAQQERLAGAQAAGVSRTAADLSRNLAEVRASLGALTLRAPVAGRLTGFTLQPGQTLKAGDPVGTIDDEAASKLTADVDEFYLGRVSPGQHASAEGADGAAPLPLTVSRVSPQVKDGRFRAELTFDRPPPRPLQRGQSMDVRIVLGATRPALLLPNGPWVEAVGGTAAFVLDASGRRAARRAVTLGRRNPAQVEVTSGLKPGERVLTTVDAAQAKFTTLILR